MQNVNNKLIFKILSSFMLILFLAERFVLVIGGFHSSTSGERQEFCCEGNGSVLSLQGQGAALLKNLHTYRVVFCRQNLVWIAITPSECNIIFNHPRSS